MRSRPDGLEDVAFAKSLLSKRVCYDGAALVRESDARGDLAMNLGPGGANWASSGGDSRFALRGSDHPSLPDGEVGSRTPLTLPYDLLHFGAADHSMRPIRKGSQWENRKASVEASVRASQFARKRIYGDEVMGVVPLELPSQVFQTVAIRFGRPPRGRPARQDSWRARLQPWSTRDIGATQ